MTTGFSRTEIIGYVGRDAALRRTQKGTAVCNFTVAVNHKSQDTAEWTQWFDVTIWQSYAESIAPYIKKGGLVRAEGYINPRMWTNDKGEPQVRLELTVPQGKLMLLTPGNQEQVEED